MTGTSTLPALGAARMGRRLTAPFERGADTLALRLLPTGNPTVSTVESYDFAEHRARFNRLPEPHYVVILREDLDVATAVRVTFQDVGTAPSTVTLALPAGTLAGDSFLLPLPVSATGRVTQVTIDPVPPIRPPAPVVAVTALLGNLAKLLWVIGAERDQLRRHAARTVAQRHVGTAVGPSLDLIGNDLGVPRFPPLSYGFDTDTVALYHLDDVAGATPPVADLTAAYPGRTGHPGTLTGTVQLGQPGRYGSAMAFRTAGSSVDVASSPAFDIPARSSATVECFVRPDAGAADGPVLSRHPAPGGTGAGWVLAIGDFGRGLAANVRFTAGDGTRQVELFADVSLPTNAFSHIAGVLDGAAGRATLYVDGVARASGPLPTGFGAVTNTAPLRIGAATGGFRGTVDEVRLSSVARPNFAPALGESDEHYQRRLRLFRRWTLPTPANLTAVLNEAVGPINGLTDPLVVDDQNATLVRGTRLVHVRPATLLPGECMDATGRRRVVEPDVVGTAAQDDTFDPAFLFRFDHPDVDFTPTPGGPPADPHLMHVGVADRLTHLAALAAAEPGPPGRLLVGAGFDPRAADLRATGRAVLLGHSTVPPDRLAALAHRIGFDFVCHRSGPDAGPVYAAIAPAEHLTVELAPDDPGPTDATVGSTVDLSLRPAPPPDAFVRWLIVPGGVGRATLTPVGPAGSPQPTATLRPTAAGQLIVRADVTRGGHTVSATRLLRVGLADLASGSISADGTLGVPATNLDQADAFFHPVFLVRHDDPRADYGGVEDRHRMQAAVAENLDLLLAELERRQVTGRLVIAAAFDAGGDLSAREGRRLVLRHPNLAAGPLAAAAFAVGFAHVERSGADVVVRQPPGQLLVVRGPVGVDRSPVLEIDEGSTMDITATPNATVVKQAGLTGPAPGGDPQLSWATGTFDTGEIALDSSTQPTVRLTARAAGTAWAQASYLLGSGRVPYTFQVRLRGELNTPATKIAKDQYDLIMNILNTLHPVGVEVDTSAIRPHVIEIQGDRQQANPEFTFPKFRVRGPRPRQVKGAPRG